MTVRVSKPAVNLREELADLRKPTGIAGEAMLRAETPQEQFNLIGAGRRNWIINGGLDVWQRSTSTSELGLGYFAADRFWSYAGGSGNVERSTDVPDGFNYSLLWNRTSGGSLGTSVELSRQGHNPYKMLTYSMYLKGDFTGTNLYFNFRNYSGGGADSVGITTKTDFGNYTDWTRVIIPVDCTGIAAHANNKMLNIEFAGFPVGGKITGVQLELGKVATPFEHPRSYGDELAKCQRYFQVIGSTSNNFVAVSGALSNYTTIPIVYPVKMRAAPSSSFDAQPTNSYAGGTKDNALYLSVNEATMIGPMQVKLDAEL